MQKKVSLSCSLGDDELTVEVECVGAELEFPAGIFTGTGTLVLPICKKYAVEWS